MFYRECDMFSPLNTTHIGSKVPIIVQSSVQVPVLWGIVLIQVHYYNHSLNDSLSSITSSSPAVSATECRLNEPLVDNTVETILHLWKVTPKNCAVLLKFLRQPHTNNLIF